MMYVVLFAGTIWGVVTLRSRQLVKEKCILEHKVHVRTEEVIQQKEQIEAQRDNLEKSFKDLKNAQTQLIQSEKIAHWVSLRQVLPMKYKTRSTLLITFRR